jgi:nucleosome assembly protein 1-like 1
MKNHQLIQDYVKKHDEPLVKHLKDIRGRLLEDGISMTLEFEFYPAINEWFDETLLIKTYHMIDEDVLERTECTTINWKPGKKINQKLVKKKQKNKRTGEVREIEKMEDRDSFFNFFKNQTLPPPEEMEKLSKEKKDELGEKLDEDYDLGNDFLNEVIPEALETYLKLNDTEGYSDLNSSSGHDEENPDDDDK